MEAVGWGGGGFAALGRRVLFGAVGDPEEVVELLRMARIGVVGAFVLVLDFGAGGLHAFSCFSRGVPRGAVDRAGSRFWEGGIGEGQR